MSDSAEPDSDSRFLGRLPSTREEWEAEDREWKAWKQADRPAHARKTQEEKDRELVMGVNSLLESMGAIGDQYAGLVESRMEDIDYDWKSRDPEEKMRLFEQASWDVARALGYKDLASHLAEINRDRFISECFSDD